MSFKSDFAAVRQQQGVAPWLAHYPSCVPAKLGYPSIPVWGLLERTAESHPDRVACHYYKQQLSYKELFSAARRTAAALARLGVRPGDRVGLLLPNVPEYISALNGIWMAGGIAVAMSPLMVPEEVSQQMAATDCRVVISLDLLAPLICHGEYRPEHVLFTSLKDRLPHWQRLGYAFAKRRRLGFWPPADSPNQHSFEELVGAGDREFQPIGPASLDDPVYILPTGGTTGSPKAVVLSHRNLMANAWQLSHWAGGRVGQDTFLAVLPFFHSYGLSTCAMTGVAMAATLVLHHRFVPRVVLQLIREHQPTIFPAVPAMLSALNGILRHKTIQLDSLQFCISGGAPLPPEVAEEFAAHTGAVVVEGYGLSEASPVTHTGPLDGNARAGTIGLPLPDTEARIVDAETGRRTLPSGEVGELVIRGPQVMRGYWENPEATDQVIRDGWLYTGDLGTCDEDGFFRIVDRKKDLIITSGFNVYPTDVEHILRQFSGIDDVAVIGVPDSERGELVKAVIAMKKGSRLDRHAFDRFCRQHLSKHKRPRAVEVVENNLPRNFLGKVQRRQLREQHRKNEIAASSSVAVIE